MFFKVIEASRSGPRPRAALGRSQAQSGLGDRPSPAALGPASGRRPMEGSYPFIVILFKKLLKY